MRVAARLQTQWRNAGAAAARQIYLFRAGFSGNEAGSRRSIAAAGKSVDAPSQVVWQALTRIKKGTSMLL